MGNLYQYVYTGYVNRTWGNPTGESRNVHDCQAIDFPIATNATLKLYMCT